MVALVVVVLVVVQGVVGDGGGWWGEADEAGRPVASSVSCAWASSSFIHISHYVRRTQGISIFLSISAKRLSVLNEAPPR